MDYDFAPELRGPDESDEMNVKGNWVETIISGLIVGVIVAGAARWGTREDDTRDQVVAVRAQMAELVKQFDRFNDKPYARRDELSTVETRVTGLEQRVGNLEGQRQRRER